MLAPSALDAATQRRRQRQSTLDGIKLRSGCVDCGYREHAVALDFDHVEGEKVERVSAMVLHSWAAISEEIAKCEVVCANCHRVRTARRAGYLGARTNL